MGVRVVEEFVVAKFEKQTGMQWWEITVHQSIPRHFQRR